MPPASTRDSIQQMSLTIVIQQSSGWPQDYIHRSSCSNWNSQNLLTVLIAEFLEVSKTKHQFHLHYFLYSQENRHRRLQTCKCHVVHRNWKIKRNAKHECRSFSRSNQNHRISSNVTHQVYYLGRMGWFLKCSQRLDWMNKDWQGLWKKELC